MAVYLKNINIVTGAEDVLVGYGGYRTYSTRLCHLFSLLYLFFFVPADANGLPRIYVRYQSSLPRYGVVL